MIRLLRNTRLWMKGAALLLVTLAALGATSWIARDSLTTLHDGLDSLFEHSMPKMDELMALNDEVKEVHIELFRTLSWAMAGLEGAVMDAQYGRAAEEVAALKQRISAHVAGDGDAAVEISVDALNEYIEAAESALDLAPIDPVIGGLFMNNADDAYLAFLQGNGAEMARARAGVDGQVSGMMEKTVTALRDFTLISSICLALAALLTLLVIRSVTGPIARMTRVMKRLAENDLTVEIPGTELTNETGQMARAVAVFRDNALERDRLKAEEERVREAQVKAERAAAEARQREAEAKARETAAQARDAAERAAREREERELAESRAAESRRVEEALGDVIGTARRGDFSRRIDQEFSEPSMREVRNGINALVQTVDEGLSHTVNFLAALAKGDLTARIDGDFEGAFARLKADANNAAAALESALVDISQTAGGVRLSSEEISTAAGDLARRTEGAAATLEETASALNELTASVKSAAEGAAQANGLVQDSLVTAQRSEAVVAEAVAAMGEIARVSTAISQSVNVINDIAFQTNLLALNAGVEAARAGESGRGFAVVAAEVRALAQRAADSAREIDALIRSSSVHVERGVGRVGEAGQALTAMATSIREISGHVEEISTSASEQSLGIHSINDAVMLLDQTTQQNAAVFEETSAASRGLLENASDMAALVGKFRVAGRQGEARQRRRA